MEKVIYLLWDDGATTGRPARGDDLRGRLFDSVVPGLVDLGARGITLNVHDSDAAPAPSPAPAPEGEPVLLGEVSVWVDSYDRRGPMDRLFTDIGASAVAAYLVTESLYDDYGTTPHAAPRSWPDGERSPGVLTVALIHRPAGLAYDDWIERWHGTQSPRSVELQPRTRYVRNEVVRAVTPGAPEVHGIVEEGWPSCQHVADPMLFFNADGAEARRDANLGEMIANVSACLDLDRLRSQTMSEYLGVG